MDRSGLVEGQRAVFAVGDCAAASKSAMLAESRAQVAAANVVALARGKSGLKQGPELAAAPPFAVVPVGPAHGAAQLPGIFGKNVVGFAARYKAKDYLAGMLGKKYTGSSAKEAFAANAK